MKITKNYIEERIALPSDESIFKGYKVPESNLWRRIENQVKLWAIEYDSVYVVTGLVKVVSDSTISNSFYKAVLKGCQGDAIGFYVEDSFSDDMLKSHTITIDKLEEITNMDFFPSLDKGLQEIIEPTFNPDFWPIAY